MANENLLKVGPGEIDAVLAHLRAGHQVVIIAGAHYTKLTIKHLGYIRASSAGKGYRAGWPGKRSVYLLPENLALVRPGFSI